MAGSTSQGKCPVFLLLAGLIGLSAGPALSQETVFVGGAGSSVEINLDVLDQLGAPQTVPQMLQTDIRRGQVHTGMPLPLPGEAPATVSRSAPMPPPTRPATSQTRRVVMGRPAAQLRSNAPKQPTLPTARSRTGNLAPATITPRVPATARVTAPVPSAPKVARAPAPIVAPPAKVAITAPAPRAPVAEITSKAPATTTKIPDIEIPAAPTTMTQTSAIVPPPPPSSMTTPATAVPSATVPAAAAKTPEPVKRIASASPSPQTGSPKASSDGAAFSISFDTDSKSLPANTAGALDELARKMIANESMRVQLLAYASAGERSEAKARRLSLSRALEVRSYLISKGIASTRMDVRALGNQSSTGSPDRVDMTLVNR